MRNNDNLALALQAVVGRLAKHTEKMKWDKHSEQAIDILVIMYSKNVLKEHEYTRNQLAGPAWATWKDVGDELSLALTDATERLRLHAVEHKYGEETENALDMKALIDSESLLNLEVDTVQYA